MARAPRVLLVWNPVSTGVDADCVGSVLVTAAEHVELTARHTLASGDAGRYADEAVADEFDAVFVLGGDGTANEVLNGLGPRLPIGVLPGGGTSVLPRVLGLPEDVTACTVELCRALIAGSKREVGLGILNGRRFAVAAGVGLDAEIVQRVDERVRGGDGIDAKRPGDIWFVKELLGLVASGEYAEPRMRVHGPNGDAPFDAMTVFVANTDPWSFAGPVPLRIAPEASFEGELELVAVTEPIVARSSIARVASLFRAGDSGDAVRRLTVDRARIVCAQPTPVQVDGEFVGELTEIELGVERHGATFLVGERRKT